LLGALDKSPPAADGAAGWVPDVGARASRDGGGLPKSSEPLKVASGLLTLAGPLEGLKVTDDVLVATAGGAAALAPVAGRASAPVTLTEAAGTGALTLGITVAAAPFRCLAAVLTITTAAAAGAGAAAVVDLRGAVAGTAAGVDLRGAVAGTAAGVDLRGAVDDKETGRAPDAPWRDGAGGDGGTGNDKGTGSGA
jgi:hypothetical protein